MFIFSFSSIGYIFGYLSGCVSTYICIHYANLYSKIQNDIVSLGYNAIKIYTDLKESAIVKKISEYYQRYYDIAMYYLYDIRYEPLEAFWTYSCALRRKSHVYHVVLTKEYKFDLIEKYNEFGKYLETKNKNVQELLSMFLMYKATNLNDEKLGIIKYENNYIIRYFCGVENVKKIIENTQKALSENNTSFKRSKFGFLSVEYTHPQLSNSVPLDITKNMCMVGNHLFSPEFVLKCLKYQNQKFYFDLHYKIQILDNDLNKIELSSNQYIELTEKSYIIKTIY